MGSQGKSGHVFEPLDVIMMSPEGFGKGLGLCAEEIDESPLTLFAGPSKILPSAPEPPVARELTPI
jgi:hypothetical protein